MNEQIFIRNDGQVRCTVKHAVPGWVWINVFWWENGKKRRNDTWISDERFHDKFISVDNGRVDLVM